MASAQTLMSVDTSASEHGHPTSIDGRHEAKVIYDGGVGCCTNCTGYCSQTHIKITSRDIEITQGLICKTIEHIDVWRLTDIGYKRGCRDCMCGTGVIALTSSDQSCPHLTLKGIPDAEAVYRELVEAKQHTKELRVEN